MEKLHIVALKPVISQEMLLQTDSSPSGSLFILLPELHLHAVRFGRQRDAVDRDVVGPSCVFGPDELEPPQQGGQDEEELHAGQTLPQAHART